MRLIHIDSAKSTAAIIEFLEFALADAATTVTVDDTQFADSPRYCFVSVEATNGYTVEFELNEDTELWYVVCMIEDDDNRAVFLQREFPIEDDALTHRVEAISANEKAA